MPYPPPEIAKLGEFIVREYRDEAVSKFDLLAAGHFRAGSLEEMQRWLGGLPVEERERVRRCVLNAIDSAMMHLLHALEERTALGGGDIRLVVDGRNVAELSDGLAGDYVGWVDDSDHGPVLP